MTWGTLGGGKKCGGNKWCALRAGDTMQEQGLCSAVEMAAVLPGSLPRLRTWDLQGREEGHVPVPGGRKMLSHTDLWFGTQIQLTHIMTYIASTVFPKATKWIVLGLSTPLACWTLFGDGGLTVCPPCESPHTFLSSSVVFPVQNSEVSGFSSKEMHSRGLRSEEPWCAWFIRRLCVRVSIVGVGDSDSNINNMRRWVGRIDVLDFLISFYKFEIISK